jgi:sulfate transport system ATP-binding protein
MARPPGFVGEKIMSIEVSNISKTFGSFAALKDVSLKVQTGELVALLGPSGSGKTTLLRIIAGLEQADAGTVLFHDRDVTQDSVGSRRVGFVFQHYALFRHMRVFDNIAFGLRVRPRRFRPAKSAIRDKVRELLQLVQLEGLADRYPAQLSGGQRQRVALARALAVEPSVLLLDEPFGALDAKVRRDLRRWLRHLHEKTRLTSLFVTHDQEEALELADRVAVLNAGKIEQFDTPQNVYDRPANPFVFQFLGSVNLFHGRLDGGQLHVGQVELPSPEFAEVRDAAAVAYVRPHELDIVAHANGQTIPARVNTVSFGGPVVYVELTVGDTGQSVQAAIPRKRWAELNVAERSDVHLAIRTARIFPDDYSI